MKNIVWAACLLGLIPSTYSVSPRLIHYAKSALQIGSGVALWALPLKWGVADEVNSNNGISQASVDRQRTTTPASTMVKEFVEKALKAGNVQDVSKVSIRMKPDTREYYMVAPGGLEIPYDNTTFEKFITDNQAEKCADARAAITHEASHCNHKDEAAKEFFNPLIMFGTSTGALLLQKLVYAAPSPPNIPFTIGRTLASIPVYLLSSRFKSLYSQHCEWRADENIPQERALLESQISYYKKEQEKRSKLMQDNKSRAVEKLKSGNIVEGLKDLWISYTTIQHDWFSSHPRSQKRQARFEQRLAELDKTK